MERQVSGQSTGHNLGPGHSDSQKEGQTLSSPNISSWALSLLAWIKAWPVLFSLST